MAYARRYFRFRSKIWPEELEVLHFGTSGYPLLLFPSSCGRFFEPEDRGLIASLRWYLDSSYVQIFCLDTRDWETFFASNLTLQERRDRWLLLERHWVKEFIPYACDEAQNDFLVVAGCALGATHALNLALRHPTRVRRCLAMGGIYDIAHSSAVFNEFSSAEKEQELYFMNPMAYMANMSRDRWVDLGGLNTDIKLLTAHEDGGLSEHLQLSELLHRNRIPHQLEVWNGGHDWHTWAAQLSAFA
ncbi:alpha/beta hydrolase-fold protein [Kamptonema cortianum]|uniref:Alpha/beta hydrolase-fold protein n=1 Tax=Geitlerinema calcuttense NRMC-F 0142 TaxID=2922238 RepID=A0ABT7LZG0_9CYAN|nr:alpha/beta hydrolase-fold protein [Geitlerinema calcuttense]MDK3156548.1 alpha/beta hydrolase-fold protein [Kamptonema cortianum]MDL5057393.1 alpha/beta hydrolase-fold protein [Geitlerinema calcuttense NRMC-F 0142]